MHLGKSSNEVEMFVRGILKDVNSAPVLWALVVSALTSTTVYGFDYSCSNCTPPECICASAEPPGGLDPTNTPQLVLITFDDAVWSSRYTTCRQIFTNHYNPNGTPIQATLYINTDWNDYQYISRLHAQGHEIGVHTMTHTTSSNTDIVAWRSEIYGARKALADLAQIPLHEIRGFRAPHLGFNNASFQAVADAGFEFDASVKEVPGNLSTNGASYIWPYTLDNGLGQEATTGLAPTNTFPGLFEVPIWVLLETNGNEACTMDCPHPESEFLDLLKYNFTNHYDGNRAPMGLFLHYYWLENEPWRIGVINQFISWALTNFEPNVWFVSSHALVEFMRDPVDIASATSFPPFITITNSLPPEESLVTCSYTTGTFKTWGECPAAYPKPDTVFKDSFAATSGVVWINIYTSFSTAYGAHMVVSNNSGKTMIDWKAEFEIGAGELDTVIDGNYETNEQHVTVWPVGAKRPIASGEVQSNVEIWIKNTGGITNINNLTLTLYDLTPKAPTIYSCTGNTSNELVLTWDNTSPGYKVMFTSNINAASWQYQKNVFGRTSTVINLPTACTSGFYRLKVQP